MEGKHVCLEDIAEAVNLSVNTVSRALNDKPGVNEETRLRIKSAARKLGYKPNAMARSLRGHSMNIIGVIIDDNTNPYLSEVLKGIESKAYQMGYHLLFFNSNFYLERELKAIDVLLQIRAKGIIMHPIRVTDKLVRTIENLMIPMVLFGTSSNGLKADTVRSDNVWGIKEMMHYLLERGYRNMAFLNLPEGMDASKTRWEGVCSALSEHGLPGDTVCQYHVRFEEGAYGVTHRLMTSTDRPDCIVCGCDLYASQAMEIIYDLGFTIPHDIGIAGYDNINFSKNFRVPLTTVSQPKGTIGELCMELLDMRIRGKGPKDYVEKVLRPTLIVRAST